jgi:heat shock protein HslJ
MTRYFFFLGMIALAAAVAGCQTSGAAPAGPSLTGTEWRLSELDAKAISEAPGVRHPFLKLDATKGQVSGISGVNRFFGGYEQKEASLKFGRPGGTKMAGTPEAMALERAFLAMLAKVDGWSIQGNELALKANKEVVARFVAGTAASPKQP